jgi:hypothetical protein
VRLVQDLPPTPSLAAAVPAAAPLGLLLVGLAGPRRRGAELLKPHVD